MVITILSQKGAQTKTSTAVNLAAALAKSRPGFIVDVDYQQCDAMKYQGSIEGVGWGNEFPSSTPDGGFVVVDTPPQIGEATGEALLRSDLALIPCTPHGASLESLARTFQTIERAREQNDGLTALVVFTCVNRGAYTQGVLAAARVLSQWPVVDTEIPLRTMDFEKAYALRRPVVTHLPKSAGAKAYDALALEIETRLFQ